MTVRRVSSRQRLVSWDAFDATDDNAEAEIASDTDGTDGTEGDLMTNKRKRKSLPKATVSNVVVHNIPLEQVVRVAPTRSAISWELPAEVQLDILKFLNLDDLSSMAQTSREIHSLLQTREAVEVIWKPSFSHKWTWLPSSFTLQTCLSPQLDHLPHSKANLPKLLAAACTNSACHVDERLFTRWSRSLRTYRPRSNHKMKLLSGGRVQFTGQVGLGDRCVRANAPLARPSRKRQQASHATIFSRFPLCRTFTHQAKARPFVSPFTVTGPRTKECTNSRVADAVVNVAPRLVAYFEVSILKMPEDGVTEERPRVESSSRQQYRANNRVAPECIAVGLATDAFSLHTRMPGWDKESYGYHGDDGGIFHAAGSMLKQYGSHFGVGDTVGCGIDYVRQAIFYCLNGEFLGYAFELKEPHLYQDLFPVVGLDTNCPIHCNFGTTLEPFQFDLPGMMAEHEDIITRSLHPL